MEKEVEEDSTAKTVVKGSKKGDNNESSQLKEISVFNKEINKAAKGELKQ